MAGYVSIPTLEADFLNPYKTMIDVKGNAMDSGRDGNGQSISMDTSGGGRVIATFEDCLIKDKEQYEYINWLGARLNGSYRFINVPIITDWFGPFPTIGRLPTPIISGIPHSDDSLFSDESGYSQATVYGKVLSSAGLRSGTLRVRLYGASRDIRWTEWFSIAHPIKGNRAYRNWDILAKSGAGTEVDSGATRTYKDYTLAISPPLRQSVSAGTRVEFARPSFVAKFPADFTLPLVVEAFFVTKQTLQFEEAN